MLMLIWVNLMILITSAIFANIVFNTGRHHIRYAILPHSGSLSSSTVRTASAFNNPFRFAHHPSPSSVSPLLSSLKISGADNLVLDTVKRGEDDEDIKGDKTVELPKRKGRSVICRLYDSMGGKSRAVLEWGVLDVAKVYKVNVLEDDLEEVEIQEDGKGVEIEVRAFEVASYRLGLKK